LRLLSKGARPLTASDAKLNILDEAQADARNAVAPELPGRGEVVRLTFEAPENVCRSDFMESALPGDAVLDLQLRLQMFYLDQSPRTGSCWSLGAWQSLGDD
jgi:hypothetical protein